MNAPLELRDFRRLLSEKRVPKNPLIRVGATPQLKAINEAARSIDFLISDDSLDRDNDTINVAGWDLDNYRKNPVVLFAHDPSQLPVAKAPDTRINANALISTAIFATRDEYPFADMVFRMYAGGFMNATSVGFRPLDYELHSDHGDSGEWGCEFRKQELLEYSCVPVPANANALMRAMKAGIDTAPLKEWLSKLLDGSGRTLISRDLAERLYKAAGGTAPIVHNLSPDKADELRRKNLLRVSLDTLFPNAKTGQAFAVGEKRETEKWTRNKTGGWEHGSIDPAKEKILATGEVVAKTESQPMNEPKPVYVKRAVLNHKDVHKWMQSQGYKSAVKPEDMHVTVMHSKEAVDPEQLPHHDQALTVPVHRSMPTEMGDKGAHVLRFESQELAEQHQAYCDAGCVHTESEFQPHVTLTYVRHPDHPDHNVEAYSGELKLGPEIHHEVKETDDFEPPEEMSLEPGEYGQDPDDAEAGNAPKAAEIIALAKKHGRPVTLAPDGTITIGAKGDKPEPKWKCSAAEGLPIDEDSAWDGDAAKTSIFSACGFGGDKPDTAKAAKYFLAHDSANPTEKASYKLPFAKFVDGKATAVAKGISAAEGRLTGTDIPDEVKTSAGKVIDHYKARMDKAVSLVDVRKVIAEEIAKHLGPASSDDKITIKLNDGTILKTDEDFEAFIATAVGKAVRKAQGKVD